MRFKFIVIFLFSFSGSRLMAQNNFKGIVLSAENDQPLAGVTISVANKPVAVTDEAGVFQFS